jgi:hypothetical protein
MKLDAWIEIRNWQRFQHYGKRRPVWIKNYTALLGDDDYLALSGHLRAVLHGLWLMYAAQQSHVRVDTTSLSRHLQIPVTTRDLLSLTDAGFIHLRASKPASTALADGYPRREVLRTSLESASARATSEARASAADKTRAACESLVRNLGHEMPKPALAEELHQLGADDDLVAELLAKL